MRLQKDVPKFRDFFTLSISSVLFISSDIPPCFENIFLKCKRIYHYLFLFGMLQLMIHSGAYTIPQFDFIGKPRLLGQGQATHLFKVIVILILCATPEDTQLVLKGCLQA